jgi:acyl homoserine lactone synthase
MIIVVEPHNADAHKGLLEQMFRLRARVFRNKLKWDVDVRHGLERDKYDDEGPVYLLYTDEDGRFVRGSLRLLPTTGPTLLADTFSDSLPDAVFLSAPTIWECTRFCVDAESLPGDGREEVLLASGYLLEGLGRVALRAGITTILGNFAPSMLRVYRRLGCFVEVLGCTRRYGEPVYLGLFPVSATHLLQISTRLAVLKLRLSADRQPEGVAA